MQYNNPSFSPFGQNQTILKNYFKKPAVLIEGIVQILAILLSFATTIVLSGSMNDFFTALKSIMPYDDELQEALDEIISNNLIGTSTISSVIPSVILTGFVAFAFIYIYVQCNSSKPTSNPSAGFTILYVFSILGLVGGIIAAVVLAIAFIAFIILFIVLVQDATTPTAVSVIFFVLALFFMIAIAITLIYYISKFKYYSSIKKSNSSITLSSKGAKVYGVINIVFAVFSGLSILSTSAMMAFSNAISGISNDIPYELEHVLDNFSEVYLMSIFAFILSTALYVLEAIIALGYKKYINGYTNNYNNVFETPSMQAQPYMQPHAPQQTPVQPPQYTVPTEQQPRTYNATPQTPQVQQPQQPAAVQPPYNAPPVVRTTCPVCNNKVSPDDMFCNYCSTRLK